MQNGIVKIENLLKNKQVPNQDTGTSSSGEIGTSKVPDSSTSKYVAMYGVGVLTVVAIGCFMYFGKLKNTSEEVTKVTVVRNSFEM